MTKRKLRIKNSKLKTTFIALLILSTSLFLFLQFTKPALAGWWPGTSGGTNWAKRQQLNLTNNSSDSLASTTTVAVTVDTKTLVSTGKLRPDCNDLRIVYQPTSSTYTELTRHISYPGNLSCSTSGAAKVYFSLQGSIASAATDSNYYLYYGNQQAEALANTDNAFDMGSANASLVCPFDGTTTCAAAETNTAGTPGAVRYSGSKSAIWFSGIDSAYTTSIDYVTSSAASIDNLLAGDATIEFWIYWQDDGTTNGDGLVSKSGGGTGWYIYANKPSHNISVNAYYAGTDLRFDTAADTLSMDTWHHVAISYISISKSAKIYVDGTEATYTTQTKGTLGYSDESANDLYVGKTAGNVLNHMRGGMDELRISNVLRYTGNFTPQTAPFTADSHTKLLYHFDENGYSTATNIVNDDTPNNSYGTANNCSYISGFIGTDSTTPNTGYMDGNNAYSGHAGTAIEEATTNKITNPSFENDTYNTNWTAAANLTVTENTSTEYVKFGSSSAKIVNTPVTSVHFMNYDGIDRLYYDTTQKRISQGFQVGSNTSIYSAVLYSFRSGTDSGNNHYYQTEIQTDNSGVPSNTPVTNGTSNCLYHNNLVNATDSFANFTFSTPPSVSASTQYHLVLKSYTDSGCTTERTSADTSIYLRWFNDGSSPTYASGQRALMSEAGTWTSSSAVDSIFALYDEADSPVYTTTIDPNSTATHTLSAYVYLSPDQYTFRGAMNYREIQLVWEGVAQTTTTYTLIGGGWWRVSYQTTTTDASNTYGIYVGPNVTAYVDGLQLEANNHLTSYTDGSLGTGYTWSGTAHDSTSTRAATSISYPTSGNISNTTGTISMWVKFPTAYNQYAASTMNYVFATQEDPSGDSLDMRFSRYTNQFSFNKGLNYSFTGAAVNTTFAANTWQHLVGTWSNASGISLTVNNGTPATNSNTTMPDGFGTSMYIGNNFSNSEYHMQATVSDVRIFSTALSTAEITDLYYAGLVTHSKGNTVDRFSSDKGQNPLAVYHFDESSGSTAADSSTYRNDLTVYTGATWNTQSLGAANNLTRNLKLDGSTGIASRSADTDFSFSTGSFSVSTWFRHSSTISGTDTLLADYGSAGWKVYMNTSGYMCFGIDDDSTFGPDDSACSSSSYADSKWHHLEAVKNGTTSLTLYIDGNRIAVTPSLTATGSLNSVSGFFVGADTDHSNHWDGWIDELVLFAEARTADQAKTDFQGIQTGVSYASQASDPFSNGLLGYWKMDEASGTSLTDTSGEGNTGTAEDYNTGNGDGNTPPSVAAGKFGNARNFDGTDDGIPVSSTSSVRPPDSISVSAWINADDNSGNRSIISRYYQPSPYTSYDLRFNSGNLDFSVTTGGTQKTVTTTPPSTGVWHLITGTYDGSALKIYVDGVLKNSVSASGSINYTGSPDPWEITNIGSAYSSQYFDGKIDEARIYNRALSPSEVTQLYNFSPGPVGYWKLDEVSTGNSTVTRYDSSGYSNNLTDNNTVSSQVGKFGQSSYHNRTDTEYLSIADASQTGLDITGDITVSAWIKPTNLGSYSATSIISKKQAYNTNYAYQLTVNQNGAVYFGLSQNGTARTEASTATGVVPSSNTTWTHIEAVTRIGQDIRIYINGILASNGASNPLTITETAIYNSSYAFQIGGDGGESNHFNGAIDDVKVYSYARTPSQIIEDMNASHPAPGSPVGSPYLEWDFDEGYSTVLHDTGSTKTHTGTTNAAWTNSGKNNKALSYNGTSHFSNTSAALDLSGTNTMSVSFWLNWDAYANDDDLAMESSANFNTNDGGIIIDPNSGTPCSGSVQVAYNNQSIAGYRAECMSRPSAGIWHHWAITFNYTASGDIRIYIDGVEQVTSVYNENNVSSPAGNFGNYTWYLMSRAGTSLFGAGKMDDFRIYTFELTPDQVKAEYNSGMSQVLGSLSTTSTGVASNSSADSYCPPGQSTACVGPVAEWKLDENTGTTSVYDTSGNSLVGTMNGFSEDHWVTGKKNSALSFDSGRDITTGANLGSPTNITVEAWIKRTGTPGGYGHIIGQYGGSTGWGSGWNLNINNGNYLNFFINTDNVDDGYEGMAGTGNTLFIDTNWHHIVGIYDGQTAYIYLDGVIQTVATDTSPNGNIYYRYTDDLRIGKIYDSPPGDTYFPGIIDEIKVYNYARTPAQIAWDYNRGAPISSYDFDECSGDTLHDNSYKPDRNATFYHGTITPGASGNTSVGTCGGSANQMWYHGATGKYNSSLDFDGTDDYVTMGDQLNMETDGSIAIEAWVNRNTFNTFDTILAKTNDISVSSGDGFALYINAGDRITLIVGDGTNGANVVSNSLITTSGWNHIVASYNGTTGQMDIYINGVLDITSPGSTAVSSPDNALSLVIGAESDAGNPFDGQIDNLRIYKYPPTADQVKILYNKSSAVSF